MMIVQSCKYKHPEIGTINVRVNANAQSIRARWIGPEVHITIPRNCPSDQYDRFIDEFGRKIKDLKPSSRYYAGQLIDGNFADFEIVVADDCDKDISCRRESVNPRRGKKCNYTVLVRRGILDAFSFSSPTLENHINRMLLRCAMQATADYLLPRARELAAEVGRAPLGWDVKDSKTRLGCCSSGGIITISPRLIFLPQHLSDSGLYHELAHLSEMNHSAAFHELCNSYCKGREGEWRRELKAFKFPVF